MVNLFSDTQTRPTPAMREAMARAEVGDEQRRDDPTVLALEARVAELLGHEAAVFLPSGTMCNEIAIRAAHPARAATSCSSAATPTRCARRRAGRRCCPGAVMTVVEGEAGMFTAERARRGDPRASGRPTATRRARGWCASSSRRTWAAAACGRLARVEAVLAVAAGARAAHAPRRRPADQRDGRGRASTPASWAGGFDTAWLDFTKGLGAPVGACLAGSQALIDEAWRWKQMIGGAMRQAGHHRRRPACTRSTTTSSAWPTTTRGRGAWPRALAGCPASTLDPATVETNIVVFAVPDAPAFCAALEAAGVTMLALDARRVRAVTHLDVDDDGIDRAIEAARTALAG